MPSASDRAKNSEKWRVYDREYQRAYYSLHKSSMLAACRRHRTKRAFLSAIQNPELENGWPDASRVEVKVGFDFLSPAQVRRFAWLKQVHDVDVRIQVADTHEDLQLRGRSFREFASVPEYLAAFAPKTLSLWIELLQIYDKVSE